MHRILWCFWIVCQILPAAERWEIQYFYDKSDSTLVFEDFQFTSVSNGVALGEIVEQRRRRPVLAVTANGGNTWDLVPLKESGLSLFFLNPRNGWIVSDKGNLWKTADGGRTWKQMKLTNVRAEPVRVFFLDEGLGWLLCDRKQVYSTTNGGSSWQLLPASAEPDLGLAPPCVYTWAAFQGNEGVITGWSRAGRRSNLPAWMEPDISPAGRGPTTSVLLHTLDGGKTWKPDVLRNAGEIVRVRTSPAAQTLLLLRRPDSPSNPSAIFLSENGRFQSVYSNRNRWLTDLIFAGPGRVFAAAIDQEGRSPFPTIPSKLKILTSVNGRQWTEMTIDYRAEAGNALLAAPDASHAWAATDTGMILRWVRD